MKELIFFIGMAVMIAVMIEINERVKAKRKPAAGEQEQDCPSEKEEAEDCSGCGLIEVCEKEKKTTAAR